MADERAVSSIEHVETTPGGTEISLVKLTRAAGLGLSLLSNEQQGRIVVLSGLSGTLVGLLGGAATYVLLGPGAMAAFTVGFVCSEAVTQFQRWVMRMLIHRAGRRR